MTTTRAPKVHSAILRVMELLPAIGKGQKNKAQGWNFRGIDDIYNKLGSPLRAAGLTLGAHYELIEFAAMDKGFMVVVKGRFTLTCVEDGSTCEDLFLGQAADYGDKAISKAKSMALKYWAFQKFLIPVRPGSADDGDKDVYEIPGTSLKSKYFNRKGKNDE